MEDPYKYTVPEKPIKAKKTNSKKATTKIKESEEGGGFWSSIFGFDTMYNYIIIYILHIITQVVMAFFLLPVFPLIPIGFLVVRLFFEVSVLPWKIYEEIKLSREILESFDA